MIMNNQNLLASSGSSTGRKSQVQGVQAQNTIALKQFLLSQTQAIKTEKSRSMSPFLKTTH